MEDEGGITWGQMRRMSDGELRAVALMEPGDDELVAVEDMHNELGRRERERMIRQIRVLLVVAALSLVVIAVTLVAFALLAFRVIEPASGNF